MLGSDVWPGGHGGFNGGHVVLKEIPQDPVTALLCGHKFLGSILGR